MDPSKTQHRNLKRRRLSRVKRFDDGFVTNQWQMFSMNVFPNQSSPKLKSHLVRLPILQICRTFFSSVRSDVFIMDFWLSWKFFPMNVAAFIITAIKHVPKTECSSPSPANVGHSFVFFSHLIIYSIHEFCCIISHEWNFEKICRFVEILILSGCLDLSSATTDFQGSWYPYHVFTGVLNKLKDDTTDGVLACLNSW